MVTKKLSDLIWQAWKFTCQELKIPQDILSQSEINLNHPDLAQFGDFSSNLALMLAKKVNLAPLELANNLKISLDNLKSPLIKKIEVVKPGFINLYLADSFLWQSLDSLSSQEKITKACQEFFGQKEKFLIEHTSPNTNKSLHIGHLRNNLLGLAIARLLKITGNQVVLDCIYNDRGIHICKAIWAYLKKDHPDLSWQEALDQWLKNPSDWPTPERSKLKGDRFVEEYYNSGTQSESEPENKKEMQEILIEWEKANPAIRKLWSQLNSWTYKGLAETYKVLASHHDHNWYESEFYQKAKDLIQIGLKKKIFQELPDQAVLTNLKNYNLPDTIVQRSDGTSMYITQDIYLVKLKTEKFPSDHYIWLVGAEQKLYLQQVFAIVDQLRIAKKEDLSHLWYGHVFLKGQGKMSSRAGNVVRIDDLFAEAIKKTKVLIERNQEKIQLEPKEQGQTAIKIATSAIKYAILKIDRTQDVYFDWAEAINLKGNCGPYLEYTYTRALSVLNKSQDFSYSTNWQTPESANQEEEDLIRFIYRYPEIVSQSANKFSPHLIAQFLFELCQKFNLFYEKNRIIGAQRRLVLTYVVSQILKSGLNLLGIEVVEKM